MSEIGLFPLELVLLPTERVPLNIFEPRYKELIGECLERDEEFGIVLAKESGDVHHVGTRARVIEVLQVLPDGRMHVVVQGGERFRLIEVDHERSFDTGTVETLVDQDDPADPADVARTYEAFRRLQETVGAPGQPPDPASPQFDYEVAARVEFSTTSKQELLEQTSPRQRVARLADLLERAQEALLIDRELRKRAHGNGRVTPPEAEAG
jgi:ATP-dependent Lon protease